MWIKKKEIEQLSEFVKGYSSGEKLDIRVNKEGSFNILKNDIYALVNTKNEQIKAVETERDRKRQKETVSLTIWQIFPIS